jgi:tetratricopeptide (TPR) repeat protein
MKRLRVFIIAAAASALVAAGPVAAQQGQGPGTEQKAPPKKKNAQKQKQKKKLDRNVQLDGLYAALKAAPTSQIAKEIEKRIDAAHLVTDSDTLNLLMIRARTTMEAREFETALALLDSLIEINPRYTEAWAQRATLYFVKKDIYRSLADLRVVLAQEPRHYQALAGLGIILQDLGEDKRALEAFRRALEVNPHLENVPELVRRLKLKVEGRDI